MIFDVIGDIFADRRQLKQLVLDDRIVGLLGKLPIHGRLVPQIVRPIHAGTIPMSRASRQPYAKRPAVLLLRGSRFEDQMVRSRLASLPSNLMTMFRLLSKFLKQAEELSRK